MTDAELAAIERRWTLALKSFREATGIPSRLDYDDEMRIGDTLDDDVPSLVAEVRRLREREAALEKVVALAECGPPMHRFPVAPPIIGFTDNEGPIYPPGYDPTRHAEDCTGCKFDAARAALAALDAKEKSNG